MEKLIRETVMDHLMKQSVLSDKQHGFISGRSATTQLLVYLDICTRAIVDKNVIDVIYLDFWKAFDTVPHQRLLGKLESYGIKGNILKWIKAFLVGRTQEVIVNGVKSKCAPVVSGIPQGSVLGPLLFILFINDMPEVVDSNALLVLFADDAKLSREIAGPADKDAEQEDIDSLQEWSKVNECSFHPDKCHVLRIGEREMDLRDLFDSYHLGSVQQPSSIHQKTLISYPTLHPYHYND